ncbi:MAG TPA: HhH-GPD-type base excision DNA repair protein [Microthrixaceae bacterium]|nr:HhH-GPD-type base excision DNA repair protein [Microthrixaceae bacterium]
MARSSPTKPAPSIPITGDPVANALLVDDPLALLIGMLLDQQVPMEWAFMGPSTLTARLGGLDAKRIAAMDPEEFVAVCASKPAIHRFPASMGRRIWEMCSYLADHYDGDVATLWTSTASGDELYSRLRELPGYGDEKSRIFMAILGKRLGVAPAGWEQASTPFSDEQPRSVADVADDESLQRVREWKKAKKAAKKAKTD